MSWIHWKQRFTSVVPLHDHVLQVETFLMSPTFSSKGGFRIKINGVTIYQVMYCSPHIF